MGSWFYYNLAVRPLGQVSEDDYNILLIEYIL